MVLTMLYACSPSYFERLRGAGVMATSTHTALPPPPGMPALLLPWGLLIHVPSTRASSPALMTLESALLTASRGEGSEGIPHYHFTVVGWQGQLSLALSSELAPPLSLALF